jgi:hypothetical protein
MEKWSLLQQEEVPDFSTKSTDRSAGVSRSGQATPDVQQGSVQRGSVPASGTVKSFHKERKFVDCLQFGWI